jgi:hypothetical protein
MPSQDFIEELIEEDLAAGTRPCALSQLLINAKTRFMLSPCRA